MFQIFDFMFGPATKTEGLLIACALIVLSLIGTTSILARVWNWIKICTKPPVVKLFTICESRDPDEGYFYVTAVTNKTVTVIQHANGLEYTMSRRKFNRTFLEIERQHLLHHDYVQEIYVPNLVYALANKELDKIRHYEFRMQVKGYQFVSYMP